MIKFLQSGGKFTKYALGGILLVICLSMCLYLIPGFMGDTTAAASVGVVARVGGEDIRADEVQKMARMLLQQQKYPEMLLPYMTQQAAQQLITQAEIQYEGDRMGLKVSDEEVQDDLRNGAYSQYLFPNGKWIGQDKYEELLGGGGTTVADFERNVRFDVLRRKVLAAVVAGIDVSPSQIEQSYKERNAKVKFDYAIVSADDVEKSIKPAETELQAFFNTNKGRYQNSIPAKRQVRYFVINDQAAASKVAVTPSDLQQYYSSHRDQYQVQERVKVRHILIKAASPGADGKVDQQAVNAARAKAADILKQIKSGGDFAELAKRNSEDPGSAKEGGELNWIVKGQTVPEFEKAAFSMSKGQMSDLVQSSYGFHIIQTEDKEAAHLKPLAEVRDSIEPILKQQKTGSLLDQMANGAQADAKSGGMEKAAEKVGAHVVESNPVAQTDVLPGIGSAPEFMRTVFGSNPKDGPQVSRFPQGYAIYEVTKIEPARTPSFDEIKDRVTNDFKTERSNTSLQQKIRELADRAHAENDLRKAAKELGATVKTSDLVGRSSQVSGIGSMEGAASAVFSLKQGEISGPLNVDRNGVVVKIVERQEAALGEDFAKTKDTLREQLMETKRNQALSLFVSSLNARLEKEGKVKIYKNEMDSLAKNRRS